jgi:hypothetical protein
MNAPPALLRRHGTGIALGVILAAAFGLRIALSIFNYVSNFDSATPGLMALHILRGEDFPLFYYGQHYMGALEAYVAAAFFFLFGVSDISLSLSAIVFSLGWTAGTYAVFSEIGGRRAGLVAAATTIAPPWTALWYSVLTYGGYPATFCLGTWVLWLCLRIQRLGAEGRPGFIRVAMLGLLAGLALWTNYMSASFLLTGILVLLAAMVRGPLRNWRFLRLAWGIPFFLAGVWPVLLTLARHGAGQTETFNLTAAYIRRVVAITFLRRKWGFGELLFSPERHATLAYVLYAAVFGGLVVLAAWTAIRMIRRRETPRLWAIPLLYVTIFFALYLPHSMAWVGAPRYLMPVWAIAFAAAAAVPAVAGSTRAIRIAAGTLAAFGVGLLFTADARAIAHRRGLTERDRQWRHAVVDAARDLGLRGVEMTGGHVWGLEGQVFSFYSKGNPYFASVSTDRYPRNAERLDTEDRRGFLVESKYLTLAEAALRDLGAEFGTHRLKGAAFIHSVKVPEVRMRNLNDAILRVRAEGTGGAPPEAILDMDITTRLQGTYAAAGGITVEFSEPCDVGCLRLMSPHPMTGDLPGGYRLETSDDGTTYKVLREVPKRFAVAYAIGSRAYLRGAWGMMEIRFAPVRTRFLRLTPLPGATQRPDWMISEIGVFGPAEGTPTPTPPAGDLVRRLREESVHCLFADRWLSATIRAETRNGDAGVRVLAYYKPPDSEPPLSFVIPRSADVAVAVESCFEKPSRDVLLRAFGPEAVRAEWRHGDYVVLALNTAAPPASPDAAVEWFGRRLLLRSTATTNATASLP